MDYEALVQEVLRRVLLKLQELESKNRVMPTFLSLLQSAAAKRQPL